MNSSVFLWISRENTLRLSIFKIIRVWGTLYQTQVMLSCAPRTALCSRCRLSWQLPDQDARVALGHDHRGAGHRAREDAGAPGHGGLPAGVHVQPRPGRGQTRTAEADAECLYVFSFSATL